MIKSTTKTILTRFKNWEKWFWNLKININKKIWLYINLKGPVWSLCEKPECSEPTDFNQHARTYAELSQTHQKTYENTWRYYDQDMKYYFRQQDQLQTVSVYIMTMILKVKKTALDSDLLIWKWLLKLKKDSESSKEYMWKQMKTQYCNILRVFKLNKLFHWLDKWKVIMIECIKYNLTEIKNDYWLRDLTELIKSVSEIYCW